MGQQKHSKIQLFSTFLEYAKTILPCSKLIMDGKKLRFLVMPLLVIKTQNKNSTCVATFHSYIKRGYCLSQCCCIVENPHFSVAYLKKKLFVSPTTEISISYKHRYKIGMKNAIKETSGIWDYFTFIAHSFQISGEGNLRNNSYSSHFNFPGHPHHSVRQSVTCLST